MNPPKVYEETIPRSQSTIKITKIVHSMAFLPFLFRKAKSFDENWPRGISRTEIPRGGVFSGRRQSGRLPAEATFTSARLRGPSLFVLLQFRRPTMI
jgi:hypothetical protein